MARRAAGGNGGARPLAFGLAAALVLAGCIARPTGDFGRAAPSVIHDDLMPAAGAYRAARRGEPVSDFTLTDDEAELRDRAFAFLRAPHARDWWYDAIAEGERTRLLAALDDPSSPVPPLLSPAFDTTRYYAFLRTDPDRSPAARWNRVEADMTGDALLVPPFCAVAARVRRTDVERLAAADRSPDLEPAFVAGAEARVAENEATMAAVWRALAYRIVSYRTAIDHLTVESPSDRQWTVNRAYDALAASRCTDAPPLRRTVAADDPRRSRRSRLLEGPDPFDQPVLQK